MKNPAGKVILLVIDEARSLLNDRSTIARNYGIVSDFRLLRRALVLVNECIGEEGGIFGVLIDTNSKVSDLAPPLSYDPEAHNAEGLVKVTFPPFVLTHTMDAHWKMFNKTSTSDSDTCHPNAEAKEKEKDDMAGGEVPHDIAAYKAIVLGNEEEALLALIRMGRPLWWSTYHDESVGTIDLLQSVKMVVLLAAKKLLLGTYPDGTAYNETTMYGVASMLCRLGERPYMTSALASQAVADFMAILAYVNFEKDGYLSSYASDPVLALGAMKVWYTIEDGLAKYILPQLRKLILDEAVDTGGIGEMVARILLLLAMDKCAFDGKSYKSFNLKAQFVPVYSFLAVLQVCELEPISSKKTAGSKKMKNLSIFKSWIYRWKDWRMGFTHFVQLQVEPNEDTLWYLLGRRAAGIFPRNQNGADLIIPMFCSKSDNASCMEIDETRNASDGMVSMILILVKNRFPTDSEFNESVTRKLSPKYVFTSKTKKRNKNKKRKAAKKTVAQPSTSEQENPLRMKSVQDVIRIYVNLGEKKTPRTPAKFIYYASIADEYANSGYDSERTKECVREQTAKLGFTFCFNSLGCDTYPFLTKKLAQCLANFIDSRWNPIELVDGDLNRRRTATDSNKKSNAISSNVLPDDVLKVMASEGLVDPPGEKRK
ncbi:hypothetical protein CCR75_008610 [Bremia lactucae]|uniref:Uncharacterized protein n=1 Tax=Bremia lactucae TaxID=4779 RepID=A0A976FMF3_BRELC|nr:hypothetical protein CCR75_008610 [Bremia lactucae]